MANNKRVRDSLVKCVVLILVNQSLGPFAMGGALLILIFTE